MTYSIVENNKVIQSGVSRPTKISNTYIGNASDIRKFGYYPEVGNKPQVGAFEKAVVDTATLDGDVVRVTYRVESLPPPKSISRRQGKQQLIIDDLDEAVETAIASVTETKQRKLLHAWYTDADPWERDNAYLQQLGNELGLTNEQIDTMFKEASKL